MKTFYVHVLLALVDDLNELCSWSANEPEYVNDDLTQDDIATALALMSEIKKLCIDFGFSALLREIDRNEITARSGCTYVELGRIAENLKTRIRDEYEDVLLLWIMDKDFYQQDSLFGDQVAERFKSAATDIKEAGTCYALGRYTACVYHSMRVAEGGLNAIAKRVGYPDPRPGWEAVLRYVDSALKSDYNRMSALFRGDIEFISGISAQMHAVNLAWRRRVAHVERVYTEEEAKQIMDATKNLVQHLATKLSELNETLENQA
jgi:hypothetical protein